MSINDVDRIYIIHGHGAFGGIGGFRSMDDRRSVNWRLQCHRIPRQPRLQIHSMTLTILLTSHI